MDTQSLLNQTVVVTGALRKYTREEVQELVEAAGGKLTGAVSKNTDLLVAGDKAGSKLEKATELGIKVLDEEEFIELIDKNKNEWLRTTTQQTMTKPDIDVHPMALRGKAVVITGVLEDITRKEAQELVEEAGGKVTGSVSKNTHLLIAGDKAGSKLTKAKELEIEVISESIFLERIDDDS